MSGSQGSQKPTRLLIVITTLTFGGAETQVVRLAHQFVDQGWEVAVACLIDPSTWVEDLTRRGVQVHSLGMKRGSPDLRAILRLRALIKQFQPDLVHSHMFHANLLARVTRLFCAMPALVCTAHNLRETSEAGGPTWHKELLYRLTDGLADRTTIICKAAFDRYVKVGAVPAHKFEVVPNGVDIERFAPSASERQISRLAMRLSDSTFVWLAVGRLVEQKDYPTLLSAVREMPNGDYVVLVAGNGPLRTQLEDRCAEYRITERVRFLGARSEVTDLYAAADAFVMSSEFEGLSAALLEASAMGLPAVATDVGGNAEIISDGETGYLVPAGNAERLSAAMCRLMSASVEHRALLGAEARQRCLQQYRFDAIASKWNDLYRRLVPVSAPQSLSAFSVHPSEAVEK